MGIYSVRKVGLKKLAQGYDWECFAVQDNPPMMSFKKDSMRINVYYTKMTVGTCVDHPKQGKTQLFRKNVSIKEMEQIFKNPRVHTRKGYQKKKNGKINL